MILNRIYSFHLPNWQTAKSTFDLKFREPRLVYCVDSADTTSILSILVHSQDGVTFDSATSFTLMSSTRTASATEDREAEVDWLPGKNVRDLIAPHVPAFATWLLRVRPKGMNVNPLSLAADWLYGIASVAMEPNEFADGYFDEETAVGFLAG